MAEVQIHEISVFKNNLAMYDTGGAVRHVSVEVEVDSSLPVERQKVCVVHEILGAYLGSVVDRADIEEIAEAVVDGLDQLENNDD